MKIESIENGLKITVPEKENHSLEELEQKLINDLYKYKNINDLDNCFGAIELLNGILEYKKSDQTTTKFNY